MLEKTLEQRLEQCLEKRMDGSCRSHPPLYKDLLIWTNRVYDPTTHQIKSRISPQYNLTLKQGLVAKIGGTGTDKITFTALNITKDDSFSMSVDIHNMGDPSTAVQTLWSSNASDGTYSGISISGTINFFDGNFPSGNKTFVLAAPLQTNGNYRITLSKLASSARVISCTVLNLDTLATETKSATLDADMTTLAWNCFGARKTDRPLRAGFSREQITINGVCVANRPYCGDTKDICPLGNHGTISGTVSLAEHSDYSTFRNDEHPFAVKSGEIFPMKLDGSGYAGLVGEPDAVYHGLIATKGQPEIGTKQYLGTEYDFGDAEAITDAGISWDEWDGEDTNLDTVGTAETDLDTDYYNAITASLMTNTSIAGYAGTSNVSKRLFFKVADRVMKGDGSFLAESGRVQEILVYKRDLSASEILRVQKYCREVV